MTNNRIDLGTVYRMLPKKGSIITFGISARVLRLFMPLIFGILVNRIATFGNGVGEVWTVIALTAVFLLGELSVVLLGIGEEKCSISSFAALSCSLKGKVWAAACELPQLKYDRLSVGEWERKFSYDVEMVTDASRILFGAALNLAVTFSGTVLIILLENYLLAIPFVVVLFINILTHLAFRRRLARVSNLMRKQFYREGTAIYGCVEMQPLLRAFSLLGVFTDYFSRCADRSRIASIHNWRVMADFRLMLQTEFWMVKALVLGGCVWAFCHGALSMGAVVSFVMLVNQLIECVSDLMTSLPQLGMGYESLKALREVWNGHGSESMEMVDPLEQHWHSSDTSIIMLKNVSFRFPGSERNVIENFSTNIRRNEFVCFLGRNGAGKSTLAKLLLGQYAPTCGKIWRRPSKQAWVSQRVTAFEGSVLENVRLMDNAVSRQEVQSVIEICGLKGCVDSLPMGIDTHMKADELSGGELQVLGIARALVRKPELIVVDEVSNNLDVFARQRISRVLDGLKGKCTVIAITHDLEVMDSADRTFVFCDAGIEEVCRKEDALRLVRGDIEGRGLK